MNKIAYNKDKDNFSWNIILDDDTEIEVIKNVSVKYLEQLKNIISDELVQREHTIRKNQKNSIPVPSSMLRKKK